jgi:hypothetical protein
VSLIPAELRGPDVRQIRAAQTRSLRMIDLYRRALVIPGTPERRIPGMPQQVIPGRPGVDTQEIRINGVFRNITNNSFIEASNHGVSPGQSVYLQWSDERGPRPAGMYQPTEISSGGFRVNSPAFGWASNSGTVRITRYVQDGSAIPDQIIPARPPTIVSVEVRQNQRIERWYDYDEIIIRTGQMVSGNFLRLYARNSPTGERFHVWSWGGYSWATPGGGPYQIFDTNYYLKIVGNEVFRTNQFGTVQGSAQVALSPLWSSIEFTCDSSLSITARTFQPGTPEQRIPATPDTVIPATPDTVIPATPETLAPGRVVTLAHTASRLIRVGGFRMIRDASMVALGATRLEFRDGRLYGVPIRGFASNSLDAMAELRWIFDGMPWFSGAWESALAGQWVRRSAWQDLSQAVRFEAGLGTTRAIAVRETGQRVTTEDFGAPEFLADDWELLDGNDEPSPVDVTDWVFAVSGNTGVRGSAFAVIEQLGGGPGDGGGPTTPPPTIGLPPTGEGFVYVRNGTPTLVRGRKLSDETIWRP